MRKQTSKFQAAERERAVVTMAVWEVCSAWGAVMSDAWLPQTLRHVIEEGIEEEAIERHCQQLLQMILAGCFDEWEWVKD